MAISNIQVMYPWMLIFIIPAFFIIVVIIGKTFIRFKDFFEQQEFNKSRRVDKMVLIITRTLIVALLLAALSSPYQTTTIERKGDPTLKILVDESGSFKAFDQKVVADLKAKLGKKIPVVVRTLDTGNRSALGNGIRNNMQGNDNLLLVTDGYNNFGWDLGDGLLFAKDRSTSVNAISLIPIKKDAAVVVDGPSDVIKQTENEFFAEVTTTHADLEYQMRILVDNDEVLNTKGKGSKVFSFQRIFQEGDHKVTALIKLDDFFPENNIFYKTVRSLPRPKLLFISQTSSPLAAQLKEMYEVTDIADLSLMPSLSSYHAVIINNIPEHELKDAVDPLTKYLEDGNGILFIGGDKTFEYNGQCFENPNQDDCIVTSLLPVKIGTAGKEELSGTNVVLVIDMSGSSGEKFSTTLGSEKAAVEKALALEIMKTLDLNDNVAVVSFNTDYRFVSKLTPLFEKPELNQTIAELKYGGGTIISSGLGQAFNILKEASGSKSVILISDGVTDLADSAMQLARTMRGQGIKLHTIGVGANTNEQLMQALASAGGGIYFQPTETQKVKIALGEGDKAKEVKKYKLEILNSNDFITANVKLSASVTGFNQVIPKSSGRTLVTTEYSNPVLSTWRFGLGRVAVLSTDDGSKWGAELLQKDNSKLITRTINWVVGDTDRLREYAVKIKDTSLNEPTDILVITNKKPELKGYEFSKLEQGAKDSYTTKFYPKETGFFRILDRTIAINYPMEYQKVGLNPELKGIIESAGGSLFQPSQIDEIIKKVEQDSIRVENDYVFYRWPFALAALIIFIGELTFRRVQETRRSKE